VSDTSNGHAGGGPEQLITMANDMADYFRTQGREAAIAGIANHIKRYWTPRMRAKLNAYLAQGHGGMDELSRAAVERLNQQAMESKSATQESAGRSPLGRHQDTLHRR
jgi:formate dehydrogenase subunit delta